MVSNHPSNTKNRKGSRSQEPSCVSLTEVRIVFVQEFFPSVEYYTQGYSGPKTYEQILFHLIVARKSFLKNVLENALENVISHLHAFHRIKQTRLFDGVQVATTVGCRE